MNAECCAAWERSLSDYKYAVDFRKFSDASAFQPRFFNTNLSGDRASTAAFASRFRRLAPGNMEAWAEVAFWKMYTRVGIASLQAVRVLDSGASPQELWELCLAYINNQTRRNLDVFKSKLFSSSAIATASAFAAFADQQGRLPMVDKWIATWVQANRTIHNSSNCSPLLEPPSRTPQLQHFDFVKSWTDWCGCMAERLSSCPDSSLQWSPRDVEMAVFQAARTNTLLPPC